MPLGEWLCPRCRSLYAIRNLQKTSALTRVKAVDDNCIKQEGFREHTTEPKKPTSKHFHNNNNNESMTSHDCKVRIYKSLTTRKNPFADLVRISLLLNPREFELPEDYIPDIQFPGTSKKTIPTSTTGREARLTSYSVKRAHELDRNNLPLILRTCYFCRKGCRKAPLIHCDYCPLVFHADCIDPPLTTLPNTKWMCPNHVEPIAEEKLLNSSSYCERVKLWNHFAKPIDQESIKISFLDKVHNSERQPDEQASRFVKIGCRVPKRVKRVYDEYIVKLDRLSDADSDQDNHDVEFHPQSNETKPVMLDHLIESGKLLDIRDNLAASNSREGNELMRTDSEQKNWLEFVEKLQNHKDHPE